MDIKVKYRAVDGFSKSRRFKTLKGANAFAVKWVGATPTLGSNYAVSDDGVGKVMVEGCSLSELFGKTFDQLSEAEQNAELGRVIQEEKARELGALEQMAEEEEQAFEAKYRGTER